MRKHLRSPSPLGDGWFTYDIRDIAIYIINYCNKHNKQITNTQLNHLLYKILLKRIIDDHDFTSQTYTDELLATRSICDDISHKELYEYYKNHKDLLVKPVQKSRLS